jgi:hypothetical protein
MASDFTATQIKVLEAARKGDASSAQIDRRVRSRTISALQAEGLLYSRNIDYRVELTRAGEGALDAYFLCNGRVA